MYELPNSDRIQPMEIAHSLRDVRDLTGAVHANEIPGFQIDERVRGGTDITRLFNIMDAIEEGGHQQTGLWVPFSNRPFFANNPGEYAPHIDSTFRGVSLHDSLAGDGYFEVAHLDKPIDNRKTPKEFYRPDEMQGERYVGRGIIDVPEVTGPIWRGELKPGRPTVFSQGNLGALKPAVHFVKRRNPYDNAWRRYGSWAAETELPHAELAEKARQFRLDTLNHDLAGIRVDHKIRRSQGDDAPGPTAAELSKQIDKHLGRHIVVNKSKVGQGILTYDGLGWPQLASKRVARLAEPRSSRFEQLTRQLRRH